MIHSFTFDGLNLVLDGGSGSLHLMDEGAMKAVNLYSQGHSLEEITSLLEEEVPGLQGVLEEFTSLVDSGFLFTPAAPIPSRHKPGVVKALCLHVAHDCNLQCRYCFAGQGSFSGPKSLMPVEVGFSAVDFLLEESGRRKNIEIDFFGGEPLMNFSVVRDVTEYAGKQARQRGKTIKFTLTTNGLLLDGEKARYLKEKGFSLVFSLDGRPEINDAMRPFRGGGGSFAGIYPKLRDFIEEGGQNYTLRGTYTRYNLDFSRDVQFLTELGFKNISLEPVVGGEGRGYSLRLSDAPCLLEEYHRLTRYYLSEKKAGRPFSFFHFILDLQGGPCLGKRIKGCGAGTEYLAVTPEGHLYPCHQFVGEEAFNMGDLKSGIRRKDLREIFAGANIFSKEACRNCWARFYCGGGCHANAYQRQGDLQGVDELGCLLEKKRLECALYLKAVESLKTDGEKAPQTWRRESSGPFGIRP